MTSTTQPPTAQKPARDAGARLRMSVSKALTQIVENRKTIDWVQREKPHWVASPAAMALLYETTRHFLSLQKYLDRFLKKPIRRKDSDLNHLLLVGAYQLKNPDTAAYAVINESVNACRLLSRPWAKGLVNGTLRQMQKDLSNQQEQTLQPDPDPASFEALLDHPEWMRATLERDYPSEWRDLIEANNRRAPMSLRVNPAQTNVQAFLEVLDSQDIAYQKTELANSLVLTQPQAAQSLPGWDLGHCSVQDLSAQFAGSLLVDAVRSNISPRLLDACVAPGGKLFHLHELMSEAAQSHQIVAVDNNEERLKDTRKIGERLGHLDTDRIQFVCADATTDDASLGSKYDGILLDAPCSGSGTIRRNPDIRLLLAEEDVQRHQQQQLRLLHNLWHRLNPGGTLVYSTCSVFKAENDEVIEAFVSQVDEMDVIAIELPRGQRTRYGWQLLPIDPYTDGFFYAALVRQS